MTLLTRKDIEEILPHREPFLFVDRVIEIEECKRIKAARRFDESEPFFRGHFPGNPIVPGVILIEALAQAAGILVYRCVGKTYKEIGAVLLRCDKVSFRRLVRPGEEVTLAVDVLHRRGDASKCAGVAKVGDEVCVDGEILATFTEKVRVG